ncbi:MAG: hypothetical protein Kow00109_12560 [Acidobacteriota bacterium]
MQRRTLRYWLALVTSGGLAIGQLWAAEGGEHAGWGWWETLGRWFNLAVLVGLLLYAAREPLARFFRGRRDAIARELAEAQELRKAAEEELARVRKRLEGLEGELEEIRRRILEEAERERERILARAEEEAKRLLEAARRETDGLVRAARQELQVYVADLAVELAEKELRSRIDPATRDRLLHRALERFESITGGRAS